jgi:hypothetical protein
MNYKNNLLQIRSYFIIKNENFIQNIFKFMFF